MLDITFIPQSFRITAPKRRKSVSKKRPFSRYTFWSAKEGFATPVSCRACPGIPCYLKQDKPLGMDKTRKDGIAGRGPQGHRE